MFEAGKKSNQIVNRVKYYAGIPEIDKMLNSGTLNPAYTSPAIIVRPKGIFLQFMNSMTNPFCVPILTQEFKSWCLERTDEIRENKTNSVIGSALLGGLILGPLGAITGGLIALGDKTEYLLSITCSSQNKDFMIIFTVTTNSANSVFDFFNKNYPDFRHEPNSRESKSEDQ